MPVVNAGPDQFLLVGNKGTLENRGSAVHAVLRPGTVFVLVPSSKQEAAFEFTQETRDGIPLRFKGIVVFRITDPLAAARQFDFRSDVGPGQIAALLTHICLGELRHAVSHMTMVECIEQRKTTLSEVARAALVTAIRGEPITPGGGDPTARATGPAAVAEWGVTVEVAQVAQVFIVDAQLRQQLEAEVRNQIKLKSDQSDILAREENRVAEMASNGRIEELTVAGDREAMRRAEELELAQLARQRRLQAENLATDRHVLALEQERLQAQLEADRNRALIETPVRLLRIAREREILAEELELRRLQGQIRELDTQLELSLPRAMQDLRREILPLEQAPEIVEAASGVLRGANLSVYGEGGQLLGQLAPFFDAIGRALERSAPGRGPQQAEEA